MPDEAVWFLLIGGGLCVLGAMAGMMAERSRLGFIIRDQAARNAEVRRRMADLENLLEGARQDRESVAGQYRALSAFLLDLPYVVRKLNTHPLSKRTIPPLLESLVQQLFDPQRILIYTMIDSSELVLTAGKQLPEGLSVGHRIKVGEGQIGLTAMHKRAMDRAEMMSDSLYQGNIEAVPGFPELQLDLIAPIVNENRTLGVIAISKPARTLRDQKRMIKLVADLGSLALRNVAMFTRLKDIANRDSLTHLGNKRFLDECLAQMICEVQQTHDPLSLIMFDIDHFKRFNDTFGHLAGDQILKAVAHILRTNLRDDDVPARYGGEEFVVLLPRTVKNDALKIAEKIRRAIEAHSFPGATNAEGRPGSVTISGGVAALLEDGRSGREILRAADQALYLAKEKGRNQIRTFKSHYLSEDAEDLAVH